MNKFFANLTVLQAFGILLVLLIILWRLDLPEGGPRFAGAGVFIASFIALAGLCVRAYNRRKV